MHSFRSDTMPAHNSMKKNTKQAEFWLGTFSKGYVSRNLFTPKQQDAEYKKTYGVTRSAMDTEFLKGIPKTARILAVGANVGNILIGLQKLGYTNLYGIELNPNVVELARKRAPGIHIILGNALDIPFKDSYFDLVFTSGVLIHIAPKNRSKAMAEIYRATNKFIWGFEYYADRSMEIAYRGARNVLWKAPFASLYRKAFPDLKIVRTKKVHWRADGNIDEMFLLKKAS